jgi:hypothetical protein
MFRRVSDFPAKRGFWIEILALLTASRAESLPVTPLVLLRGKNDKYPAGRTLAATGIDEIVISEPAVEHMARFETQYQRFLQGTPDAKHIRINACPPAFTDDHRDRGAA